MTSTLGISTPVSAADEAAPGSLRMRLERLIDPGSFLDLSRLPGFADAAAGGVLAGHAAIDGRPVALLARERGAVDTSVVAAAVAFAGRVGCPLILVEDRGSAPPASRRATANERWDAVVRSRRRMISALVPFLAISLDSPDGALLDGTVAPVLDVEADIQVVVDAAARPPAPELPGDADPDTPRGDNTVWQLAPSEEGAFAWARLVLGYLPSSRNDPPPVVNPGLEPAVTDSDRALQGFDPDVTYDMRDLLVNLFDDGEVQELGAHHAAGMITALTRVDGRTVGIVANQPLRQSGSLDGPGADKAAAFVRLCDAFRTPLVFVVDTVGFAPGIDSERAAVARIGGNLIEAFVGARVLRLTLVVGKAYGGGYAVMGSKQLGADVNLAWPRARIAVMGAEDAVAELCVPGRRAASTEGRGSGLRCKLIQAYNSTVAMPWAALEQGHLDNVIEPAATRLEIRRLLSSLRG